MHQLFLELAKDLCARTHRLRTPFSRILASVRIASTSRTKLLRHVQHGRGVTWANGGESRSGLSDKPVEIEREVPSNGSFDPPVMTTILTEALQNSFSGLRQAMEWNRVLMRGALGFSVLRFWSFFRSVFRFLHRKTSVFRFWCMLRFAVFPFFSIWFSVFG